jgi:hypothetical protein
VQKTIREAEMAKKAEAAAGYIQYDSFFVAGYKHYDGHHVECRLLGRSG